MRRVLVIVVVGLWLGILGVGVARANVSCEGQVVCPDRDNVLNICLSSTHIEACPSGTNSCQTACSNGCAPQTGSDCNAVAGACGPGLGTCPGTGVCVYQPATGNYACTVGSGGGGGGSSCSPECRQGAALSRSILKA